MNNYQLFEPLSIDEALHLLDKYGEEALPMAGGTDLILDVFNRGKRRGHIVSLSKIKQMAFISGEGGLQIGAGTVFQRIETASLLHERSYEMLAEAASCVGSTQIRNLATIGGNICNALPCADSVPALTAAEAVVIIQGLNGRREVPMEAFITGPGKIVLKEGELVVALALPQQTQYSASAYKNHTTRKALDLTVVGAAALITIDPQGEVIQKARIALGNVSPKPVRAREAEAALEGQILSEALLVEVGELAVRASSARDSAVRASADYRRQMVKVMTKRCVTEAFHRAKNKSNGASPSP